MMFMSGMMLGSHLLMAVADRVPQVNFERTCREATTGELGLNDKLNVCIDDERAARDQLVRDWNGYDAEDRARCARMATMDHTASYIELLTCLDLSRLARKLHADSPGLGSTGSIALAAEPRDESETPAREREKPPAPARQAPARQAQIVRHPPPAPPVSLAPPAPPTPLDGLLQSICSTGLRDLLPACH
jgi:hypothetical protein